MTTSQLDKIRRLFGEVELRNITTAPFPLVEDDIPLVPKGGTLVEINPHSDRPLPAHHMRLLERKPDFAFIISTDSAYRIPILAKPLVTQANAIHGMSRLQCWTMQTALHELITNAINHGNLAANSIVNLNRDNLTALGQLLMDRLHEPRFAQRYLTCTMHLSPMSITWNIADDGPGFDVAATIERIMEDPLRYTGRGILMARKSASSLRFDGGGRIAEVTFPL